MCCQNKTRMNTSMIPGRLGGVGTGRMMGGAAGGGGILCVMGVRGW